MPKREAVILFLAGLILSPLIPKDLTEWKNKWESQDAKPWLAGGVTFVLLVGLILLLISED